MLAALITRPQVSRLLADVRGELLARAGLRLEAVLEELLADVGGVQHLHQLAVPAIEDLRRRLAGRDERIPVGRLEAGIARLGDGRHVGQRRRAREAGDRERAQLAGVDVRQHGRGRRPVRRDAPAEEVGHRRAAALVRDVRDVDAGALLEELAREIAAPSRRPTIHTRACRASPSRARRIPAASSPARRVHHEHVREHDAHRERRDVLLRIVGKVLHQVRRDRHRARPRRAGSCSRRAARWRSAGARCCRPRRRGCRRPPTGRCSRRASSR